ncbi:hypothetical protein [Streptomyces sp. MBT53]|uniref:hypothetical protein n=1 Tax=Streptomyces sp. MBT53 TaxID=1488384 RepID=UPI001913835F|nr:hypothetical protein [Streptomyces sp. MBT53]MBK6013412.1 hypothetical protein [Streptomyces sp. MBT53]
MDMDWSRLTHAYGSAADLPEFFESVGDPESADWAWEELWSSLYHQGTVYPASFAALPALTDIAAGRRPGRHRHAIALAGAIVAQEEQLHERGYVRAHYAAQLDELRASTLHRLTADAFEADDHTCLYPLECLLAFEGERTWSNRLLPASHDVECPSCSQSLEIDVHGDVSGTRRRDPQRRIIRLNHRGPTLTGVAPVAPAELPPLASRLHGMAVAAGQPVAADHLTRLFGRTTCPDCAEDFSVAEQIERYFLRPGTES